MEERDFIDFKFGDHWASEFNLVAVSSGDRYSPPVYGSVNPNTTTVAGKVGVYKWKSQIGEKVFNINIAFDNINGQTLNQIKEWLHPFKIDKLTFKEEPFKYYWVSLNNEPELNFVPFLEKTTIVNGIEFKEGVYKGEFNVQFVCFDNYGYSDWQSFDENYDYLLETVNSTNGVIAINDAMNVETEIGIQGVSRQESRAAEEGKTVEGKMISLSDVDNTKEHTFTIEGNLSQETREGYNILNIDGSRLITNNENVTVAKNSDGTVTLNGTPGSYLQYYKNDSSGISRVDITDLLEDGATYTVTQTEFTYKIYLQVTAFSLTDDSKTYYNSASRSAQFTVDKSKYYYHYQLQSGSTATTEPIVNLTIGFMIYKGTDTKVYEQYGAMPSFEFPNDIKSIGSNINLFNKDTVLQNYRLGSDGTPYSDNSYILSDYIYVRPNENYIYNRYNGGGGSSCICFYTAAKEFISRIMWNNHTSLKTINIVTPVNCEYIRIADLKSLDYNIIKIEKGSKATSWSPYNKGGVEVKLYNKNLLNPVGSSVTGGGITLTNNGDGSFTVKGTSTQQISLPLTNLNKYPIYLEKGKTYTQSFIILSGTLGNFRVVPSVIDNDGNIIYNYFNNTSTKTAEKDFKLNAYNFYVPSADIVVDITFKVQLEEGSSATDYELHQSQSYPIYLDRELYGNNVIKDTIVKRANKWYYKFNWYKLVLTGTENFEYANEYKYFRNSDYNFTGIEPATPATLIQYSNMLKQQTHWATFRDNITNDNLFYTIQNTGYKLAIRYLGYDNAQDFRTKLAELYNAGTPLYIIYQLAKPIYEEITNETMITQLNALENSTLYQGATHIFGEDNINLHYNYLTAIPSIKFPSEIENTENNVEIKITGKNILENTVISQTIKGITYKINEDKTITVNGTADSTSNSQLLINRTLKLKEGAYTIPKEGKNGEYWFFINLYDENTYKTTKMVSYRDSTTFIINSEEANYRCDIGIEVKKGMSVPNITFHPQIEMGTKITKYEPHKSQTITFPLTEGQKLYKGSYLAEDGIHNTRKQYIFTGEEYITTIDNGTRLCTSSKRVPELSEIKINTPDYVGNLSNVLSNCFEVSTQGQVVNSDNYMAFSQWDEDKYIYFSATNRTIEELPALFKEHYENGTPIMIEYELEKEEIIPYTQEQQEALNNIYLYTGINNIFVDNAELSLIYVPQQNIYIDYMVNCSNLLNDSSFYHDNDIYKKSYFDIDTGDATTSGISADRPVYLYNAGTTRANLNLTFDLIIPAEDSSLVIKIESCKLTDNGVQTLDEVSAISISNFSNFKPFLDIYDGNLDNWQIQIDSELCEVYVKHKTDETKIISLNKFNDEQSFLSLANCKFVDYLKPFPTSITAISDSAIENTIFNKLSVDSAAQDYRLKNVNVEWKHTYL